MKFKIDENLPIEISMLLRELSHDADTVGDESLCGAPDSKWAPHALNHPRFLCRKIVSDHSFTLEGALHFFQRPNPHGPIKGYRGDMTAIG
jgi:hypothetical protein